MPPPPQAASQIKSSGEIRRDARTRHNQLDGMDSEMSHPKASPKAAVYTYFEFVLLFACKEKSNQCFLAVFIEREVLEPAEFFFGGAFLAALAGLAEGDGLAAGLFESLAGDAAFAALPGITGAASALLFFFPTGGTRAAAATAFAPRPRRGGGGGGGGGGASGFRNFNNSVRERSLPSNSSMKTSSAIFGYSGNCGVIRSSVISGRGSFCCTCRHLVKKFLIFCATACCRAVTARKRTISCRALESSFQVRDGVAASLPLRRLARSLA